MNSSQKSWWQRPGRALLALILALVVAGSIGLKLASKGGLNREMEEIRASGLPTNPKELDVWYAAVPAAENAGLKFLEARDVFVAPPQGSDPGEVDWGAIPHSQALDERTIRMLRDHIEKNAETLRWMREAAKEKRSKYPVDFSKAPAIKFDHLMHLKQLAQLARWDALLKAERGDAAGAVEALKSGFAVAHTLAQEPLLISELVRTACAGIQVFGMQRVVNLAGFNDTQLSDLAAIIREAMEDSRHSLKRALIGERAFANTGRKFTFDEYEQFTTGGGLAPNTSNVPEVLRRMFYHGRQVVGLQDRDHAFYLRSLGRMIDAAALEYPEQFQRSETLTAEIATELSNHPIAYEYSGFSLPSIFYIPKKEAILMARLRSVELVLKIEQWRRKNGDRLPLDDDLSSVLEQYPRDPVDGAPLKFQPNEHGGYRVIAVAATEEEKKTRVNSQSPGIGFTVEK